MTNTPTGKESIEAGSRPHVGRNVLVDLVGYINGVPAKVDTGADSSTIWASNVHIDSEHNLCFSLFDTKSPYYTGELIKAADYRVMRVRSSTGHTQIRYRTYFMIKIAGRKVRVLFSLADRSRNAMPILIGRRTLHNKFIVDVARHEHPIAPKRRVGKLNQELRQDPYTFFQKYHSNSPK